MLNEGEKPPFNNNNGIYIALIHRCFKRFAFRKIVILAKLLLYEMSCSTVYKMRGAQILSNINHFIGGHNFFQTKTHIC